MFISVVIPTYNRLPILQRCLRALEAQCLAASLTGFEVVLVDDGSTDETSSRISSSAATPSATPSPSCRVT
jgi:glycosyltransferase involved in cell wall biosynthesis